MIKKKKVFPFTLILASDLVLKFNKLFDFSSEYSVRLGQCLDMINVLNNAQYKQFFDDDTPFSFKLPEKLDLSNPLLLHYQDDFLDELSGPVSGATGLLSSIGTTTMLSKNLKKKPEKTSLFESQSEFDELQVPDMKLRQKNVAFIDINQNDEIQIPQKTIFDSVSEEIDTPFFSKNKMMDSLLEKRRHEFIDREKIKVLIGSWNVAEKTPKETITKWLHLDKEEPDIIAIGLQEIDMSALTVVIKEESGAGAFWDLYIQNGIDKRYIRVFSQQLVGIYHILFIKKELKPYIKNIFSTKVGTGDLGVFANKGGVGIRFELYESSFCFFSTHLAAHKKEIQKRNQNFNDIMVDNAFDKEMYAPYKHDYIFFYGDLNYRIQLKREECVSLIKDKNYDKILEYDQLMTERREGRVLTGFSEAKITFAPTYKYDKGTTDYDSERTPSYTDRILYRTKKDDDLVKVHFYESCIDYMTSDHKPIVGYYELEVEKINEKKYQNVINDEINLDKL